MVRYVLRGRTFTMRIPPVSAAAAAVVATLRFTDTRPTLAKATISIRSSRWGWGVAAATTCCTRLSLMGALQCATPSPVGDAQDRAPPPQRMWRDADGIVPPN